MARIPNPVVSNPSVTYFFPHVLAHAHCNDRTKADIKADIGTTQLLVAGSLTTEPSLRYDNFDNRPIARI